MKLKYGYITHTSGEETVLVCAAGLGFSGLVRLNATAAFLVELLKEETSKEVLCQALMDRYGIDPELARKDVTATLEALASIDALE